jgi:hypothetical protein
MEQGLESAAGVTGFLKQPFVSVDHPKSARAGLDHLAQRQS